jgi:hypothetical protein
VPSQLYHITISFPHPSTRQPGAPLITLGEAAKPPAAASPVRAAEGNAYGWSASGCSLILEAAEQRVERVLLDLQTLAERLSQRVAVVLGSKVCKDRDHDGASTQFETKVLKGAFKRGWERSGGSHVRCTGCATQYEVRRCDLLYSTLTLA